MSAEAHGDGAHDRLDEVVDGSHRWGLPLVTTVRRPRIDRPAVVNCSTTERQTLRIGTWNLAGRWTDAHRDAINDEDCDIWLLTEVSERLAMGGYHLHRGEQPMAAQRRWAGVLSREPLSPMPDPHPASAMARVGGLTVCSSILPWKGTGRRDPWVGERHVERTQATMDDLAAALPRESLVWGGDWNHALSGREYAGSIGGRRHLLDFVAERQLQVPTAELTHQIEGLLSIDHIAFTDDLPVGEAHRFHAIGPDGRRLSDHDGYVVTLAQSERD